MSVVLCRVGQWELARREGDRYVDATRLCKAAGKLWADYARLKGTEEFLEALAGDMGIPISRLVQVRKGNVAGDNSGAGQGTWIHPRVAMHFAQWVSPKFAVAVSGWLLELLTTGKVELATPAPAPESSDPLIGTLMGLVKIRESQLATERRLAAVEQVAAAAIEATRHSDGYLTVLGWGRENKQKFTLHQAARHGRILTKYCSENGINMGAHHDPRWGHVNSYPVALLNEYFKKLSKPSAE